MLKQFLLLFTGTFFISLFVLMMQFLWRYVDDLIGKGLSMDVLAQFFWYMSLFLVPQALPLAVLLASLITMGNIGENSELTAIKAAGIPLTRALRSMMVATVLITMGSFYFQNYTGPEANRNLSQLLVSMKQKSPELEIPEGIFYDGIPNCNLYVQKKDLETGKLYGVMIYRINGSYEDAAIILADSGMLQSTADKQHLLLTLHSGEWFENMRSQELATNASVPYRRETFIDKTIVLDFDDGFNLAEGSRFAGNAQAKSLEMIMESLDSLEVYYDSLAHVTKADVGRMVAENRYMNREDSLKAVAKAKTSNVSFDSILAKMNPETRRMVYQNASSRAAMVGSSLEYYKMMAKDGDQVIREHKIEMINKFTLALTCLIFFFIGAPLGAIIRKGGLGLPVIISVLVFIVFYILDNTGYRMARVGEWPIWFGKGLAPSVLIPLAAFVTLKANKDSSIFNMDAYRNFFMRLLGLRFKRNIAAKEVIINDPDYANDALALQQITDEVNAYAVAHKLAFFPNIIKVFFNYQPDHEIKRINESLETTIDDLANSRDRFIMDYLNRYPVMSEKAHTRPFDYKWMNIAAFVIVPVGIFLYLRMWRFRIRLLRDIRQIRTVNELMIKRINELTADTI